MHPIVGAQAPLRSCQFLHASSQWQLLLTRLQIEVVQHQLSIGQAWLRFDSYLVREVREPGVF